MIFGSFPKVTRGTLLSFCYTSPSSSSSFTSALLRTRNLPTTSKSIFSDQTNSFAISPTHITTNIRSVSFLTHYHLQTIPVTSQRPRHFSSTMSANGEARPKRRNSPISAIERPKKQLKQENGMPTPGDATPQNGSVYDVEADSSSMPTINTISAAGDSPEWQATIERVIKSVVSIHFCQTCSFDTDLSTSSQATGFVVDSENGYIMTNRHVVCSGPFWGYCVFDNHEEVHCYLSPMSILTHC